MGEICFELFFIIMSNWAYPIQLKINIQKYIDLLFLIMSFENHSYVTLSLIFFTYLKVQRAQVVFREYFHITRQKHFMKFLDVHFN